MHSWFLHIKFVTLYEAQSLIKGELMKLIFVRKKHFSSSSNLNHILDYDWASAPIEKNLLRALQMEIFFGCFFWVSLWEGFLWYNTSRNLRFRTFSSVVYIKRRYWMEIIWQYFRICTIPISLCMQIFVVLRERKSWLSFKIRQSLSSDWLWP